MGGDIYRVGARQGATPPSTPVHEVDSGQGSSGPETDIHIYVQSRPLSLPPPRAPSRARLPANRTILHASHRGLGAPWVPLGPTHGGAWPRRPGPSPRFPPLRGASHLSIFCCQLANARGLPRPAPRAPRVPSPTPGEDALVPAPHRNPRPRRDPPGSPRFPPGGRRAMPCHAMLDGRLGGPGPCSVARCQATVRLPLRCATKRLDASPPRPRAVAPVMPCHPIHRIDRRGPLPCRLTDPHWPRIVRASVPRSQLDSQGAHKCTQGGPPPASQPSPPLPSLAVNWREQEPCHLGAQARPPRHRPSHPLPSNAANWQRVGHIEIAPPGTYQGTSKAPGTFYYS